MKQFLLNKYGNSNLTGFEMVADIVENYKYPIKINDVYKELGDKHNLKYQAVERRIRTYKNACGYVKMKNHEFISMILLEIEITLNK